MGLSNIAGQLAALQERQRRHLVQDDLPEHLEPAAPAPLPMFGRWSKLPAWAERPPSPPRPLPLLPPPSPGTACPSRRRARALLQRTHPTALSFSDLGQNHRAPRQSEASCPPADQQLRPAVAAAPTPAKEICPSTSASTRQDGGEAAWEPLSCASGGCSTGGSVVAVVVGGSACSSFGRSGGGKGGAAALGAAGRWRRPLPWAHLAEREVEEAAQTADGDQPCLLAVCNMFADWQAGEPDIAMGLGVQGICSGEAGAPSSAHGGTDGGAPDGAAPPHPSLGQSPSTPALPPDLCAPRGDEEQQPLQLEAAAGQERSAASGESQQQQQEAQPQQPQQVPEAQPPLTPEQLQTLRWMTAALEGDLVTAARALRAVEAALSGVVPPECFNFLDGSSISSSRKGSIGSSRNSNKLGFGIPGLGAAQQAAPPLDVQQQPTPPRLRPWWLQLPGSWPHEQAYAAFERRAITYARHLEGLLKAALEWTTPFGWLPVSLRVMPPGCDPHKVEQELAAVYVQALEENDEAGRSWPDLCHAMARGLHAAYNGSAAPAGTAGVDTAGAAGASAAVTAAGADAEPMPRPPAPEASAEGGGGMAEVAAAPGAAEGDAAPVAAPAPSSSCGGGEQQVMLADQQEEKTTAAAETVPPGLRQMRKKADSRGRAQREVRPVKRLQRLTEEERVKQLHDKEQAEWEAQELKIRACAPVLAAALTPGICSAAARRQILRLLLWDPCSDKPPSEVAASSNSANAGEQTGRGAGADLLSPWRVPQEAAAEEAEARAEEVLISRFLADVYPPVKERWRWVLHAAARGHKDSLQVRESVRVFACGVQVGGQVGVRKGRCKGVPARARSVCAGARHAACRRNLISTSWQLFGSVAVC